MVKNLKQDVNNYLNEDHGNTSKQLSKVMEVITYMKLEFNKEIQLLKKSQIEIKLEMNISGNQTKTSAVCLTKKLKDRKERISGLEGKVRSRAQFTKRKY